MLHPEKPNSAIAAIYTTVCKSKQQLLLTFQVSSYRCLLLQVFSQLTMGVFFVAGHLADLRDDSEASPWEFDFYNEAGEKQSGA